MEKVKTTPQDVFFQLLAFVTLLITVFSFIALLWQYINTVFPDQLNNYYGLTRSYAVMRTAISSLVVAWPVYLVVNWLIRKLERKIPLKADLPMKKWLTYLVLFAAAIAIIVDLISLLNNFLGGELTSRFGFKVLVVLIVAGTVFGYYIWVLKNSSGGSKLPLLIGSIISLLIIVSIFSGFFIMGTPSQQRARRFDEQRVRDLQSIQLQISDFWNKKGVLPANLQDLTNDISGYQAPRDPQSGEEYIYRSKGELTFELCADFETNSLEGDVTEKNFHTPSLSRQQNWNHQIGQQCFSRTIDPELNKNGNDMPLPVPND